MPGQVLDKKLGASAWFLVFIRLASCVKIKLFLFVSHVLYDASQQHEKRSISLDVPFKFNAYFTVKIFP